MKCFSPSPRFYCFLSSSSLSSIGFPPISTTTIILLLLTAIYWPDILPKEGKSVPIILLVFFCFKYEHLYLLSVSVLSITVSSAWHRQTLFSSSLIPGLSSCDSFDIACKLTSLSPAWVSCVMFKQPRLKRWFLRQSIMNCMKTIRYRAEKKRGI